MNQLHLILILCMLSGGIAWGDEHFDEQSNDGQKNSRATAPMPRAVPTTPSKIVGDWQSECVPAPQGSYQYYLHFLPSGRCKFHGVFYSEKECNGPPSPWFIDYTYKFDGETLN